MVYILVPGLQNDYSVNSLINMGFTTIYNKTYGSITKDSDISDLKRNCTYESLLCVGAGLTGNDNMRLVACGYCLNVLNVTALNTPNYVGSAYWYYTPTKSFGYSPTNSITQNSCDNSNTDDNLRLCWHTDNGSGGYRAGNVIGLNYDVSYSKYVFFRLSNTLKCIYLNKVF